MPKKKFRPLIFKLTFSATLLVIFVASTFTYIVLSGQKQIINRTQNNNNISTLKALGQVAREAILVDDDTDMVNYVNLLKRNLTVSYAMVLYPDGRVRVHTDAMKMNQNLSDDDTNKALENRQRGSPLIQHLTDENNLAVVDMSMPVFIGFNPPQYEGMVRIGFNKKAIERLIEESFRTGSKDTIKAFIISIALGLFGSILMALLITIPLKKLQEGSIKIGEGKLDHRIKVNTHDELSILADEFNLMAQKLGELDEMKRDFVSGVTHELRSPMTSIKGYMDLLLSGAGGDLTNIQRDYLSVIKNNAVRLGRFIDNLLDVAKIEARKIKLTPEIFKIQEISHEMKVLFKPQADEKKLQLLDKVPAELPEVFADKDKIAEVFINLVSNAIKFTPENGEISLIAVNKENHLEVSVQDSGVGISKEDISKLFNKFQQVGEKKEKGVNKAQKGTGLGLTIAKGFIEAHGGKIWVESPVKDGKGTAFKFTLPPATDKIRKDFEQN